MLRVNPPTGTALKELRESANLSQRDLAVQIGCSVRTVQNWEAGASPQYRYRRALLAFLADLEGATA